MKRKLTETLLLKDFLYDDLAKDLMNGGKLVDG
jgi:hypothetical protein